MNDSQSTTTKYKTNKDLEKKKYEKKFVFITDVKNTHDTTHTRARSTSPNSHEIIFFFLQNFFYLTFNNNFVKMNFNFCLKKNYFAGWNKILPFSSQTTCTNLFFFNEAIPRVSRNRNKCTQIINNNFP
jgi:hypothetical protein